MIEAANLTKRYGSVVAVSQLSFTVRPGRVTGFLGPNGAGKSTAMRLMIGLERPTDGSVTIGGRPYATIRRPLFDVGAVLDVRACHGGRSAYHHLLCLAQADGIGRRRVTEVLDLVGLSGVARRRARTFSLGMSQRLGLAAALLGDPPVLICDEPMNGLDAEGIAWIRALLRRLAGEGRTVLVSSHLMSEMASLADHLIVIGQGRLLADGSTAEIMSAGPRAIVVVRTPEPGRLAALLAGAGGQVGPAGAGSSEVRRLEAGRPFRVHGLDSTVIGGIAARHGIAVHELTPQPASLESAFLDLTRDHVDHQAAQPDPA
jgi:ABC-2 type transport system ATP-binding protein